MVRKCIGIEIVDLNKNMPNIYIYRQFAYHDGDSSRKSLEGQ